MHSFAVFFVVLIFGLNSISAFLYDYQNEWGGDCQKGKSQSPIDIRVNTVEKKKLTLYFEGGYKTRKLIGRIFNTGTTVRLHFEKDYNDHSALPYITGDGLDGRYILSDFYFRWDSEHTLNGLRFPLELQIVHFAEKYQNYTTARNNKNGLVMLSVLHKLSSNSTNKYEALIAKIPTHPDNPTRKLRNVDLKSFIPSNHETFFRYEGSLTIPGCEESVIWSVFSDIQELSKEELDGFKKMYGEDGVEIKSNNRKLQPLNGRKILSTHS